MCIAQRCHTHAAPDGACGYKSDAVCPSKRPAALRLVNAHFGPIRSLTLAVLISVPAGCRRSQGAWRGRLIFSDS